MVKASGEELTRKKATIIFPKAIKIKALEGLFDFIAREVPGNFEYSYKIRALIYSDDDKDKKKKTKEIGIAEIHGTISPEQSHSASFRIESNQDDETNYTELRFDTIPGYDYEEHHAQERKVWDDVRNAVSDYFRRSEDRKKAVSNDE